MEWSDPVTGESGHKIVPVECIPSTTGAGEGDDTNSREGGQPSAGCSITTDSGREDEALDLRGVNADAEAEGSGAKMCIESMLPCVVQVVTGLGDVAGVRRPSVVVSSGFRGTEEDILLFPSGACVRFSST